MEVYSSPKPSVIPKDVFAVAAQHCQKVFQFRDAIACTALMLWNVLVWAAARATSLAHAVDRLFPDVQDQTFWNRLRAHLPKQALALERRLNELLRLPCLLPRLAGRLFNIAIDYHAIPYYGDPKKVPASYAAASPNAAPPSSTPTRPSVLSWLAGGTRWR
jgi:hypothetical protein